MLNTGNLELELKRFENVIAWRCLPPEMLYGAVPSALRELYATKTANAILEVMARLHPAHLEAARRASDEKQCDLLRPPLPSLQDVRDGASILVTAVDRGDPVAAVEALEKIGVVALCPSLELQLSRLDFCVHSVAGRIRLIPLIELGLFAAELGAYQTADNLLTEARSLAPGPAELYDVCTLAGVIALGTGNIGEAQIWLERSIDVCLEDEFARLMCCTRSINLSLAIKLLERGEKGAVIRYLTKCQAVWRMQSHEILAWIHPIQSGEEPEFWSPGALIGKSIPTVKIRELIIRSSFITEAPDPAVQKPNEGARANFNEARDGYVREIASAIKGKLDNSQN